ncbi:MAG TPA: nitroreductase family protein [Gaiellaceae bacterium]|nr:nitroreductase family protein [Gaiellaceae bacterium]
METFLAIASRGDVGRYRPGPIPAEVVERILDAGRLAGSAQNRQPWTFLVVESRERLERLAACVFEPENLLGAALVVAVVVRGKGPTSFDAGRAAQNMLLAAWDAGVAATPNGLADPEGARAALGLEDEEERLATVLSFGWPERRREPSRRSAEEWSARRARRPLADLVRRL